MINNHPSPNISPTADEYEESGFEDEEGLHSREDVKMTRGQLESYRQGRYVVLLCCFSLGQLLG